MLAHRRVLFLRAAEGAKVAHGSGLEVVVATLTDPAMSKLGRQRALRRGCCCEMQRWGADRGQGVVCSQIESPDARAVRAWSRSDKSLEYPRRLLIPVARPKRCCRESGWVGAGQRST